MKNRMHWMAVALALVALLAPSASLAQSWTATGTQDLVESLSETTWIYSWTGTATDSAALDVSECSPVLWNFDPSTGDASEDAAFRFKACQDDSDLASCQAISAPVTATVAASDIGPSLSAQRPYLRVDVTAATSGGDTAQVTIRCRHAGLNPASREYSGQENGFLVVGDSWVFSAGYDEPWASFGAYRPLLGGFTSRLAYFIGERQGGGWGISPSGEGSRVHVATAYNTGGVFGPAPQFDLIAYLRAHPEVHDVLLLLGTNDYLVATCSHGDPVDPNSNPTAVCTVPETIANLKYIFDRVTELGVRIHWQIPPAWIGLYENANSPGAATYQDAIEDVYNALETYCVGKRCYPNPAMFNFWCAGFNGSPDYAGGAACTALNFYDYGDGPPGAVNKQNKTLLGHEDALYNLRFGGTGLGPLRRHPSAWGYQKLFAVLADALKAEDATITQRHTGLAYDWTAIPALPVVTIGAITASSVEVTPTRGTSVNGAGLGSHECLLANCKYVCWATCTETGFDSDDPACYDGAETPTARSLGSPSGAGHGIVNGSNTNAMRDYVELFEGQTGLLVGLATGTDYNVACVAVSPTNVSHPGVRAITTL